MRTDEEQKQVDQWLKAKKVKVLSPALWRDKIEKELFCPKRFAVSAASLTGEDRALCDAVRRMARSGIDHQVIASELGLPLGQIYKWCRLVAVGKRPQR